VLRTVLLHNGMVPLLEDAHAGVSEGEPRPVETPGGEDADSLARDRAQIVIMSIEINSSSFIDTKVI